MAKPKLPTEDKRSEKIALRLTPSEATQLKEHATDAGFPQVSDYLRALIDAGNQALEFKKTGPMIEAIAKQLGEALAMQSIEAVKKQLRGV